MAAASASVATSSSSSQKNARWGIASTAKVNRHLLAAAPTSRVAQIVAVASRSQEKADQYAKENNIPYSFGSYEQMFNSKEVDIVYVSVPNDLHKAVTMAALRAKKHVLCEKPLTLSKVEAEEMFECAAENGVLLAEAVMTLHSGVVKKAKEIIQSGKIGKLLSMRGNWMIFGGPSSSGGALWGLGSYLTNMARFISDQEPTHVSCHCVKSWRQHGFPKSSNSTSPTTESPSPCTNHIIVDEKSLEMNDDASVVALAKFPTFVLTFEASSGGPLSTCFEILGDKGSITFDTPFKPKPEASSLFVKIEKNPTEEIVISDSELHGDIEHLYQIELDELSRLSFKVSNANKDDDDDEEEQNNAQHKKDNHGEEKEKRQQEHEEKMMMMKDYHSKSSMGTMSDEGEVSNTSSKNNNNNIPLSPSEKLGQHLSPQFSIAGACVLELMQKSMEQGGVMLATNLSQPSSFNNNTNVRK